jgi:UDP-N-acetylglucosamine 1-carboxyvinyltransferase
MAKSVLKVQGGNRLAGSVDVSGSKNMALALLSAVGAVPGVTTLTNVPDVSDIRIKLDLLGRLGVEIAREDDTVSLDATHISVNPVDEEIVRLIRTSFYVLGPFLARLGHMTIPAPGGCKIGERPVDYHVKGLQAMGASVELDGGVYHARADRLRGTEILLDFPSAGATQHLMSTAVLAEGCTVIHNAAMEPEVLTLAEFLVHAGARIEGHGTPTITILGVPALQPCSYRIPADRHQAGTYLVAGAITGGDVTVRGILPQHQDALIAKLKTMGARVDEGNDWVRVRAAGRLQATDVRAMPHPGFPTDMQQPMSALLAVSEGSSMVVETIYERRIGHVEELNRMGAKMRTEGRTCYIEGVPKLKGAPVVASDLRAGAALVLAGLAAEGETLVRNVHYIDRGYQDLEGTLRKLGAEVLRVEDHERV